MRFPSTFLSLACFSFLSFSPLSVSGDVYLHNPRGSNNRLNEQNAVRSNNNRLFDSQNNGRGGYNVGDRNTNNAGQGAILLSLDDLYAGTNGDSAIYQYEYSMVYFEHSILSIEWTNQHGCGGSEEFAPQRQNCDLILQYMCQNVDPHASDSQYTYHIPTMPNPSSQQQYLCPIPGAESNFQDGANNANQAASTPHAALTFNAIGTAKSNNDGTPAFSSDGSLMLINVPGRHESERYYYECYVRSRNKALFLGDRQLSNGAQSNPRADGTQNADSLGATFTRQNNGGEQSGLECPEERDYYPYWSPSPWKDIAILTDRFQERCTSDGYYNGASQNNYIVYKCVPGIQYSLESDFVASFRPILNTPSPASIEPVCSSPNLWVPYSHGIPAPQCQPAPWTRDNHLGNGLDANQVRYNWTLPLMSDLQNAQVKMFQDSAGLNYARCVLRLRYNISSDDYNPGPGNGTINYRANVPTDPDFLFSSANNAQGGYTFAQPAGVNPADVGANLIPNTPSVANLSININMAQLGRVFEDRSHIFYIKQRPPSIPLSATIWNLNIRGKRCNIVECFPAVEYGFVPDRIEISSADYLHIQWTGSNTHQNGGDGGDGQAGDAGEGKEGTDRYNIVQVLSPIQNYPIPLDKFPDNMWSRSQCWNHTGAFANSAFALALSPITPNGTMSPAATECAMRVATSGLFKTMFDVAISQNNGGNGYTYPSTMNVQLDNNPPSLVGGVLVQFSGVSQPTTFEYMNTRSNNFSNRGQKGTIIVSPSNSTQ